MAPLALRVGSGAMVRPPFTFSARTRVGFSDTDAQGVVYYGRYNPYFDFAARRVLALARAASPAGPAEDFVMRANDVEYFAPGALRRRTRDPRRASPASAARASLSSSPAYKIPEDMLLVTAHQTLVYVDLEERKALPVPDDYRAKIAELEGDNAEH